MSTAPIHTIPTWEAHDTTGLDCWCSPTYSLPCDECDTGCWKCERGAIALTRAEAEHAPRTVQVIHHASEAQA